MINDIQNKLALSGISYDTAMQDLSNQIRYPANLSDLKRNANLKFRQVQLARANGDLERAAILAYEYQRIIQNINMCQKRR